MAVDYYLDLGSIKGESKSQGFEDQIQLLSFSWGGHQVTGIKGTSGSGAGKVDLSDFSIMKHLDKATTPIFAAMCKGTHIDKAFLTAVKAGANAKPFLKLTMQQVFVTSQQVSASTEIPTESVSFSYDSIKLEYSVQDAKGVVTTTGSSTYSVSKNTVT
jgi:type VI secretion system secreted protein Hcp